MLIVPVESSYSNTCMFSNSLMSMFPYIMIFIIIIQTKCTIALLPVELLKFTKFSYVIFLRTLG
jgi:hypothetical protein